MDIEQIYLGIISDTTKSRGEKIEGLLDLGLDFLGLGIAIVSRIEGDTYTVEYAISPDSMIEPGTSFSLGETYCWHTLQKGSVVAVNHAGLTSISSHPCYEHFKLETYIGAPVFLHQKIIGTVNFSAAAPRDPFSAEELAFIEKVAKWLSEEARR